VIDVADRANVKVRLVTDILRHPADTDTDTHTHTRYRSVCQWFRISSSIGTQFRGSEHKRDQSSRVQHRQTR
jgi:hypothetical protein